SDIDVRHWQSGLADRVLRHRAAAEAEIRRPERMSAFAIKTASDLAFPPADRPLCDNERLYESWSNTTILCQTAKLAEPSVPVWVAMLGVLRPRGIGLDADTVAVGTFPRATHAAKDLPNTAAVGELPGVVRTGIGQPTLAIARAAERDMM